MISIHREECQVSELRRQRITAQSPGFSGWVQKDNEFGSNPSLGPSLSDASEMALAKRVGLFYWATM